MSEITISFVPGVSFSLVDAEKLFEELGTKIKRAKENNPPPHAKWVGVGNVSSVKSRILGEEGDSWWGLINALGWGTETTDYDDVRGKLLNMYTPQELNSFRSFVDSCMNVLAHVISAWEEYDNTPILPCSDDSFSDLRAHIVGMGKKEFAKVLDDPQFAYDRAVAKYGTEGGYTESFLYVLH